jgi:Tfp pilus assembly protein PilN
MTDQITDQMSERMGDQFPAGLSSRMPEPDQPLPAQPTPIAGQARVDLLPLEIVEARHFGTTRRQVFATVAASLVLCIGGVVMAQGSLSDADDRLTEAQATQQQLISAQGRYSAVPALEAELQAARTARTTALIKDMLWYRYLNDVADARPAGVVITLINANLTQADPAVAAQTANSGSAQSAAVLTPAGIGTLEISGTAGTYAQVSTFLNTLNTITGLSGATLTSAIRSTTGTAGPQVTFTCSVVITAKALSNRYTTKGS